MNNNFFKKQLIIVISSPSGAGKTTICNRILKLDKKIKLSISETTRKPRDNEINGVDYNFISLDDFKKKIYNKSFIEYAKVFDNYYGSSYKSIYKILDDGNDVLFDIDWQGASQISKTKISNLVTIFIKPPSKEVVYERLKKRSLETGDDMNLIKKRMSEYTRDIEHTKDYNYVIINDNLEKCVSDIVTVIKKERAKIN